MIWMARGRVWVQQEEKQIQLSPDTPLQLQEKSLKSSGRNLRTGEREKILGPFEGISATHLSPLGFHGFYFAFSFSFCLLMFAELRAEILTDFL